MTATLNGHSRNGHIDRLPRGLILDADGAPLNAISLLDPRATGYGNYGANLSKNSLVGWLFHGGDPDQDVGFNVQTLRERSRDAFMGIPLAAGAIETFDTNVVGEGLFPAPNVDGEALGLTPDETTALNSEIAEKFGWWAMDPRECDFEMKQNFPMLTSLSFKSMLLSGDCPVLFPLTNRPRTIFDLRMRVLEADRVMNPALGDLGKNIFSGVELSNEGELLAYHVAKKHPLGMRGGFRIAIQREDTVRVEPFGARTGRRNMTMLICPDRPEQRRGVPILSVCLELLKQMGRYTDATVVAAVIQSYFTAFVTSDFPDQAIFDSLLTEEQKKEIADLNPYNVQLGPGVVNFMRPGHAVNFSNPTQPQSTFGDFTIAVAKFVGAAIGMPYEVLLKQYNASYSASRAALLDFWKRVRKFRARLIDQFCQPSYEEWMADAISLGRFVHFKGGFDDPYVRRAMCRAIWTGSSAGSLDPEKEVAAADLKVKCGFSTNERESAELNGSDWRDNVEQQGRERDAFEAENLIYPPYRKGATTNEPGGPQPTTALSHTRVSGTPTPTRARARVRKQRTVELASGLSGTFYR
jgi:lambda family phage portal protein